MTQAKSFFYFLLFLIILVGCSSVLVYTHPGLDNSWAQALLLAIQKGETFGTEFVFNYGPWGYLNFKTIAPSTSKWFILFIQLLSAYNFFHLWNSLVEKMPNLKVFFSILFLFLLVPFASIGDFSFTFFYFLVYWLFNGIAKNDLFSFIIALIIVVVIFFVKLNLNVIVVCFYITTIGVAMIESRIPKIQLFSLVILLLGIIYSLSFSLNVDLVAYCKETLLLIEAYPDGMAEFILNKKELISYAFIEIVILIIISRYMIKSFSWTILDGYFMFIILGMLFLSHKQSHTAIALINEYGFLNFFPWIFLLMIFIFPLGQSILQIKFQLLLVVFLVFCGHQYYWFSSANKNVKEYVHKIQDFIPKLFQHTKEYLTYNYSNHFTKNEKPLPQDLLNKIGKGSVDIFQTEIDYIFFNQLNYNHRPVIQTYAASTPELMELNAEKFRKADAPDYVIYASESFRKQNPMWVETPSTIELLKRYQFVKQYVASNDSLVVLEKRKLPESLKVNFKNFGQLPLNKWIQIPSDSTIMVGSFDFKYSLLGKLSRLFLQPPYLYAKVKYSNGSEGDFRVITTILKEGIILNKKITTQNELSDFFEFKGKKNLAIRAIYFYSPFQKGFVN